MINTSINENIKIIKNSYKNSPDITFRKIKVNNVNILLVFNQSLASSAFINDFILKNLTDIATSNDNISPKNIISYFNNVIPGNNLKDVHSFDEVYDFLGNSFTLIFFEGERSCFAVETRATLNRAISEPLTEQTISGPKDAFNENYIINIGLIRKRIKTTNLVLEEKVLGRETKTRVGVLYMDNIIEDTLLDEVRKKLDDIDIDGILDSTTIKNMIVSKNSVFSLVETTERPDVATSSLLEGKIIIVVENSPFVLIIPTFFTDLFLSSEDNYQMNKNVSFTRILRYASFLLAILTPAFYIAITTYNHETIPVSLLVNFAAQREGVPFPAIIEAIGMSLVFEILRESDIRMPHLSGSAISILGAIVLGDAAVTAGIVSPIMVIVIAVSAICSLMFSHVSVSNAIRFWRFIFMIFATCFGIPGIFLCGILFVIILSDMKSFGKPYLYPIAPFNGNMLKNVLVKLNIKKEKKRNPLLTDKNFTRMTNKNSIKDGECK